MKNFGDRCLCGHVEKRHGAHKQCVISGCFCRFFTTKFRSKFEETLWNDFKWNYRERIQFRKELWELRHLHNQCGRMSEKVDKANSERMRHEALSSSMVSLILGYIQKHSEKDLVFCDCDLCKQSLNVLNLYGFEVGKTQINEALLKRQWQHGEVWR